MNSSDPRQAEADAVAHDCLSSYLWVGSRRPRAAAGEGVAAVRFDPSFSAELSGLEEAERLVESLRETFAGFGIEIQASAEPPPAPEAAPPVVPRTAASYLWVGSRRPRAAAGIGGARFDPAFSAKLPSLEEAKRLVESLREAFAGFGIEIQASAEPPRTQQAQ